jgi:hypothetical protein
VTSEKSGRRGETGLIQEIGNHRHRTRNRFLLGTAVIDDFGAQFVVPGFVAVDLA